MKPTAVKHAHAGGDGEDEPKMTQRGFFNNEVAVLRVGLSCFGDKVQYEVFSRFGFNMGHICRIRTHINFANVTVYLPILDN